MCGNGRSSWGWRTGRYSFRKATDGVRKGRGIGRGAARNRAGGIDGAGVCAETEDRVGAGARGDIRSAKLPMGSGRAGGLVEERPETELAESTVREYVRKRKIELGLAHGEIFVPQSYRWGQEGQVDWYEAYAEIDGEQQKVYVFCLRSM